MAEINGESGPGESGHEDDQPRIDDELALRLAIENLQSETTDGRTRFMSQAVLDLIGDKQRFIKLREVVMGAVRHTAPPEGTKMQMVEYGGPNEIIGNPWSWLSTLVLEAADDFDPNQPWSGMTLNEAITLHHRMRAHRLYDGVGQKGMPMSKELLDELAKQAEPKEGDASPE